MSTTVTIRIDEVLRSKLNNLHGAATRHVEAAIAGLRDITGIAEAGAGGYQGKKVVTSYRLGRQELDELSKAASHLGLTRSATLALALGAYMKLRETSSP